jgi:hypothetical protein
MIIFDVRHWITNHEAEIGTQALGTPEPKHATLPGWFFWRTPPIAWAAR